MDLLKGVIFLNSTEKTLFNAGWRFAKLALETDYNTAMGSEFKAVELPHDWLIWDTHNLYETGEGWYVKTFTLEPEDGVLYSLGFDGVYMDSEVYVNGTSAGRWTYGYSAFETDITRFVVKGENTVAVRVRHKAPNSRWYSGAGIYRNVWLVKRPEVGIAPDGVYISADMDGRVAVTCEFNCDVHMVSAVSHSVIDPEGHVVQFHTYNGSPDEEKVFTVDSPLLWSADEPNVYKLKTEVFGHSGERTDLVINSFGFRTLTFDPNYGFFCNGKYEKLKGVCLHHDLGALGSAMNRTALRRQLRIMKEMGANAVRTSHNMPSEELMELCDEMGLYVNSESFDMWEMPKTEFDNARFFNVTAHCDVESWVRRGRNHPSVIMWSIGNEIYDTHASERGYEIAEMLKNYVEEFDPRKNARVTIGSNFIEWENAQKVGKMLGISGYNYAERLYDAHHEKYPETCLYGSETASEVHSRGVYHFPLSASLLTHDDHQCSSLGNSVVGWGSTAEKAWIMDRDRRFCLGQFVWTGFDYIGEPTPYSTKNSYFGIVDTAGIPKDIYYFYQSQWTEKPMIHIAPYWDFNRDCPDTLIDVIAYTNAPYVELFLNGNSLGKQKLEREGGSKLKGHWQLPFAEGELKAVAYDHNGNVVAEETKHSFSDPVKVNISVDKTVMSADGSDMIFAEISVLDKNGYPVENARNRINVSLTGAGRIVGMDNGDSTDYEQYKTTSRKLFGGKLTVMIMATDKAGEMVLTASSNGLEAGEIRLTAEDVGYISEEGRVFAEVTKAAEMNDVPVRKIEAFFISGSGRLDGENTVAEVGYKVYPENADANEIYCKAVAENGLETNVAVCEMSEGKVKVTAKGDGEFRLRFFCNNGCEYPEVCSDVCFAVSGMGAAVRSPYSFVCACFYNRSDIALKVIENGALGGFSGPAYVTYTDVDFGRAGSSKMKIGVGNSTNADVEIEVWNGIPNEGGRLVDTLRIPHNNRWDGFDIIDAPLSELFKGISTVTFGIKNYCIFGGFEFEKPNEAFALISAADNDGVYGDDFAVNGSRIENIGNNVVIEFKGMDFGSGAASVTVIGRTLNEVNTIQLRTNDGSGQRTQLLEFANSSEYVSRTFAIDKLCGVNDVSFVFLPGSKFDFEAFQFSE